jgi:xanthine dehydrogenase accessory factor
MQDWLVAALDCLARGEPSALVTIAATAGSVPREAGTKMLVHGDSIAGSIGGGHLEFRAIDHARRLLGGSAATGAELLEFGLGPSLGQCCGGRVSLLFERLTASDLSWLSAWGQGKAERVLLTRLSPAGKTIIEPGKTPAELAPSLACLAQSAAPAILLGREDGGSCYLLERMVDSRQSLYLFGAGHVGRALVQILALLPYRVRWIDARAEMFPASAPANVSIECSESPRHDVAEAPPGTFFLVMTHSHALDLEICDRILQRGDFGYLGLIGSATKKASFMRRLSVRGHGSASLRRLTCPIGLPQVTGKEPGAIAVAVAGELLACSEAMARDRITPSTMAETRG